jgi:hypothetical protein
MNYRDVLTMLYGLVAVSIAFVLLLCWLTPAPAQQLTPPTPDSIPSQECSKEAPCNALIFQLELDGRPVTTGDFTQEECSALMMKVLPGVMLANPNSKLVCQGYDVKREVS